MDTKDRWGFDHIAKNPFYQAKTSKYQILDKLKNHVSGTPKNSSISWGNISGY